MMLTNRRCQSVGVPNAKIVLDTVFGIPGRVSVNVHFWDMKPSSNVCSIRAATLLASDLVLDLPSMASVQSIRVSILTDLSFLTRCSRALSASID